MLLCENAGEEGSGRTLSLYSRAAFELLSREWLRLGWSLKYYHNFSWLGQPILQFPEDLIRLQEVIYQVRPNVVIETGVFRGGSLLFHATLLQALGGGKVIGIDCQINPSDREQLSNHALGSQISLLEGSSTDSSILSKVAELVGSSNSTLVILDSAHSKQHVARELECYSRFVTLGSYIVVTDGIMQDLGDVPRGVRTWESDNPLVAATEFADRHPEFRQEQPAWLFHDGELVENVTYWPGGWLKRIAPA